MRRSTFRIHLSEYLLFIYILIMLSFWVSDISQHPMSPEYLLFVSVTQLLLSIIIIARRTGHLFTFITLFFIFSFLFHMSYVLLLFIGSDVIRYYDFLRITSSQAFVESVVFCVRVQMYLFVGILLSGIYKRHSYGTQNRDSVESSHLQLLTIYYTGLVLLVIGLLPRLYIDLNKVILFLRGNYLSTYSFEVSGILTQLSRLPNSAVVMMLIGKQSNKKLCRTLFAVFLTYSLAFMLTGNRGNVAVSVIALIFVYFRVIEKANAGKVITWLLIGYLMIAFVSSIGRIRMSGAIGLSLFWNTLWNTMASSPVLSILGEFGTTLSTVTYSVITFPNMVSYSYGMNYLVSPLIALPNVGGFLSPFFRQATFIFHFPNSGKGMGGSYIGEMYYAAGQFGVVFALILGFLLGVYNRRIEEAIIGRKWLSLSIYMVAFSGLLWWIRSYSYSMIREVIWTSILILILYGEIKHRFYKRRQLL